MRLIDTLGYKPVELSFGTSGLRGLVTDMTDLECYINMVGFLRFLEQTGEIQAGSLINLAGDLRVSTPRIMATVQQAALDGGYEIEYYGLIPTPALALRSLKQAVPGVMVTGSHIPADRNGIKFYKSAGEVLKPDEAAIKAAVAEVRAEIYAMTEFKFDSSGMLLNSAAVGEVSDVAATEYLARYVDVFAGTLNNRKIVLYQHSAVGRDLLVTLFEALGAKVVAVGRSEVFVPIDSENVQAAEQAYFRELAGKYPDAFAIISTDGDSDRPFLIDEAGEFHRGDVLGAVVATWLAADFAAYPVSSSAAVDTYLTNQAMSWTHTKIGSPYVIAAMAEAASEGKRLVGWEVNGGFLTGSEMEVRGHRLAALPTRDAAFPIIVALVAALEANLAVSQLFDRLPQRFSGAGLIDNFPTSASKAIMIRLSQDSADVHTELAKYFTTEQGFGKIVSVDLLDGARIHFDNGDIAHLRASGNAPQLRIYSDSDTQERADKIVALALAEPNGILRTMERAFKA